MADRTHTGTAITIASNDTSMEEIMKGKAPNSPFDGSHIEENKIDPIGFLSKMGNALMQRTVRIKKRTRLIKMRLPLKPKSIRKLISDRGDRENFSAGTKARKYLAIFGIRPLFAYLLIL